MNIFITGIQSFVGNFLAVSLRSQGHVVSGSARIADTRAGVVRISFGEPVPKDAFASIDAVIHCAWDIQSSEAHFNVVATRLIVEEAQRSGVKIQMFLSSLSASPTAPTAYGQGKFLAESLFSFHPHAVVIRPGLIVGNGGLFLKTYKFIQSKPILPLIGGGGFAIPLVSAPQLAEAFGRLLVRPTPLNRPWQLFHPHIPSQRELIRIVCQQRKWRRAVTPIPAGVALASLQTAEMLGLNLSIKSANLRSALETRFAPEDSDLASALGRLAPFSEILSQIDLLP